MTGTQTEGDPQENPAQPPEIDWATFDVANIPEDVIKKTKPFKEVLNESVERRKLIKQLKEQLTTLSKEEDAATEPPAPTPPTDTNVENRIKELSDAVQKLIQQSTNQTVAGHISELVAKYKVPANMVEFITGETPELREDKAKKLGAAFSVRGGTSEGQTAGDDPDALADIKNRILDTVKASGQPFDFDKGQNPFDPRIQVRRNGGGIIGDEK